MALLYYYRQPKKCFWDFSINHSFIHVCISWACWVPQNGATALCISAANGCKEVVEVLLQSGAEVNAAKKVIADEWRALIYRIVFWNIGDEMQSMQMAWAIADKFDPFFCG